MPLYRLKDYYPNYRNEFDSELRDIDSYDVYAAGDDKVGSVKDLLVDDAGRFRYAIVDTGPWIFGKNVLLPIGLANFDYQRHRVYVDGLSRRQVEDLPEYKHGQVINEGYENQVRQQYRPMAERRSNRRFMGQAVETNQPVENSLPVENSSSVEGRTYKTDRSTTHRSTTYNDIYDREPTYYGMSEQDNHRSLRLYEERLIAKKHREKVGEVQVGKHVETENQEISEPIQKERVVVERRDASGRTPVGDQRRFEDQEVARMDVYEDEVDIEKQPFVREEVSVRKETDQETVRAREKVRHEELDIDTKGNPDVRR
jgi:uncharacterized protein (TIGR02271 family)